MSNPSTGKMGFAIAAEAARRGHEVVLIAGPVAQKTPKGVKRVDVVSAREMLGAVEGTLVAPAAENAGGTVLIATAAVADWRPAKCAAKKLKKTQMSGTLKLVRNPDILTTVNRTIKQSNNPNNRTIRLVGFAAETNDVLKEASRKCREKGLEFIVANDVTQKGSGFGTDTNKVTFVFPDGTLRGFPLMTKRLVAKRILEEIENEK